MGLIVVCCVFFLIACVCGIGDCSASREDDVYYEEETPNTVVVVEEGYGSGENVVVVGDGGYREETAARVMEGEDSY